MKIGKWSYILVINKVTIKLKWRHTQMRVPTKFSYHQNFSLHVSNVGKLFPNKCVYMKKSSMITELVIKFNERMTKKSIDALAGLHFKILKSAMLHVVWFQSEKKLFAHIILNTSKSNHLNKLRLFRRKKVFIDIIFTILEVGTSHNFFCLPNCNLVKIYSLMYHLLA